MACDISIRIYEVYMNYVVYDSIWLWIYVI
ncbi:hypothetical protein F383_30443 [Gossypium arboreum]|uniref:Uncharacterized protein n=1 Tax=Gossypium arboreum TaxID=29729 RepID=A0A0B0N2B7_GOSAR|nr:hypothetical protein F383_30443 [Gossypium arboreum]